MKTNTLSLIVSLLVGFGFLQSGHAVIPPADGGYPNFTTAEGQNSLFSLTSGSANTALGWFSLKSVTTGSFNTGVGAGSLVLNTGDENTAIGTAALLLNTASGNTALGSRALLNNTTGGSLGNIQGIDLGPNVAVGQQALENNTVAGANTAVGYQALHNFTTGPASLEQIGLCTAVGFQALANSSGRGAVNNAFGYQALMSNTEGGGNTAIGVQALFSNTTGSGNVAVGNNVLLQNVTGGNNTGIGVGALENNIDGSDNVAIGQHALGANNSGSTGGGNIGIGAFAGASVTGATNVICIGEDVFGEDVGSSCYIGNIFGQPGGAQAVFVSADGKLGAQVSSRRFKEDVKPMGQNSEALYALKPVTFHYKKQVDPTGTAQFGLVAEDVERVNGDLVIRDKQGKPYTVRYDQVNAMLLNEFLKEHLKVEQMQKQIDELAAGLQKVSAQLELSKSAPQTVLNGH